MDQSLYSRVGVSMERRKEMKREEDNDHEGKKRGERERSLKQVKGKVSSSETIVNDVIIAASLKDPVIKRGSGFNGTGGLSQNTMGMTAVIKDSGGEIKETTMIEVFDLLVGIAGIAVIVNKEDAELVGSLIDDVCERDDAISGGETEINRSGAEMFERDGKSISRELRLDSNKNAIKHDESVLALELGSTVDDNGVRVGHKGHFLDHDTRSNRMRSKMIDTEFGVDLKVVVGENVVIVTGFSLKIESLAFESNHVRVAASRSTAFRCIS